MSENPWDATSLERSSFIGIQDCCSHIVRYAYIAEHADVVDYYEIVDDAYELDCMQTTDGDLVKTMASTQGDAHIVKEETETVQTYSQWFDFDSLGVAEEVDGTKDTSGTHRPLRAREQANTERDMEDAEFLTIASRRAPDDSIASNNHGDTESHVEADDRRLAELGRCIWFLQG